MTGVAKPILKTVALILVAVGFVAVLLGITIAREVPTGTVRGRVVDEKGRPLTSATVTLHDDNDTVKRGMTGDSGEFVITDVPIGKYTGYAVTRGYETRSLRDGSYFTVREGKTTKLPVTQLFPRPPAIYGSIPSAFIPGEPMKFPLRGYSRKQVARVHYSVYRYDFAQRVRALDGRSEPYQDRLANWPNLGAPIYEHSVDIRTDREGYFARDVVLPVKENGGYLIHIMLESTEALFKTLVTDLAIVTKRAPGKTLIYASSFTRRRPLQGVKLEFFNNDGRLDLSGTTDSDGLFLAGEMSSESVTVLASSGDSYAINYTYSGSQDEAYKCYLYTDRPVYRPGHEVQFKGILRKSLPGRFEPMSGQRVSVGITDPSGNSVKKMILTTDRYGSFNSAIDLDSASESGYYSISASYGGESFNANFKVEEYRKPEFSASVGFDKPHYVGGQKLSARVESTYYFGGPVAQARVTYTVYKSPDYFYYYPDEDSDTSFYDQFMQDDYYADDYYYGYGEVVLEGEAVTDDSGVAHISIPSKKTNREERYSVEASVMDASGRSVEISGGVLVTPALYTFSLDTDRYFYKPKTPVNVHVYAIDYDRKPVGNVQARISLIRQRDNGKDGHTVLERSVRIDSIGRATVTLRPEDEGYYKIRIQGRDRKGNRASGETWIWVADEDWTGEGYDAPSMQVTLDKKLYKVGDTARVMINSPEKSGYVLFTIEGRRLFEHRMIRMTSSSTMLEIPVTQDYSPNVFATVCVVKGKKFLNAAKPMFVSPKSKFLTVKIEPDKQRYLPGDDVTYRIRTLDAGGNGVPADVSLGVVDESVYAIREDRTPDIQKFFYGPTWNMVSTSISFSSEYYGGEDKFAGKVRKYFRDTAYWNPNILTDSNGEASVSFRWPDNLTTWRATARAVTADTAVGSAVKKVVVTKNLLVRLQAPRFFRQRDELTLSAVVHNYTNSEQSVRVWLDATGIQIKSRAAHTVRVGSKGAGKVVWNAAVSEPGKAVLTVYAQGQGDSDAMQLEVPVLPHGAPEVESAAGQARQSAQFDLEVPYDVIRQASVLDMGFSSSIAGAAWGLTDALESYRYESPEGLMDVLLPNIVMYQAMKDVGIDMPERYTKIQKMVRHDLKTVYQWQLPGGGWGWWEYGGKDPWMTAYVVYGLLRAKQAGLPVDEQVLRKGIQATEMSLPDMGDLGKRSVMVYALTLAGRGRIEWIEEILGDKRLQNYSLALMMLSLADMGRTQQARDLVPKLEKGAVETQLHSYWPEVFAWGFYSCNDYETTAYAIRALLAVDPQNPLIAKGVRWLVDKRQGDRYDANYDTAAVVYALADYLSVYKPPTPDYSARVYLNGKRISEFNMGPQSIYKPELTAQVTGDAIKPGRNVVRIEIDGQGEVYYWGRLKYYSSAEDVAATRGAKVSVQRQYYTLELVRDPSEGLIYKPRPLRGPAHVGQLIRCRLAIRSPKDFRYLVVEDMLPSGCEVVQRQSGGDYWDGWDYWWSGEVVRDNRVSFMLQNVYKGKRMIEYDFRPELVGDFHVMPATAQGYFEPDIFAHSAERRLVVQ